MAMERGNNAQIYGSENFSYYSLHHILESEILGFLFFTED